MFLCQKTEINEFPTNTRWGTKTTKRRKRTIFVFRCDTCGNEFERLKGSVAKARLCKRHVCSSCYNMSLLQGFSEEAKHGKRRDQIGSKKIDSSGYVSVYVGDTVDSPRKRGGAIREHILVMENHLGRALTKGEVVHHIDGNKLNNDIANLDLCTVEEHNACHAASESIVFNLYARGIVSYNRTTKRYYLEESSLDRICPSR